MIESATLCVNQKRYFYQSKREILHQEIDLLSWLQTQLETPKLYWKSRGSGLEIAAVGSLLSFDEVPQFDVGNDAKVRFWGGHSFFPSAPPKDPLWETFPRTAFFLPKHELIKSSDGVEIITHSLNQPVTDSIEMLPSPIGSHCTLSQKGAHFPEEKGWEEIVNLSLGEIQNGSFKKVVLARRSTLQSSQMIDPFALLATLPKETSTFFALQFHPKQTFVGASPERLYRREGKTLWSEAVAGTRKRGETPEKDHLLEMELKESQKESSEFNYVKEGLEDALSPLCEVLNFGADKVLKTPNVQHLFAKLQGTLKEGVKDGKILSSLHPTPAMGGSPKDVALSHLLEKEAFERGWYASPIGYLSEAEAEFVVGIRSALVEEKQLHLFAGAGIVEGSQHAHEWQELEAKTALWKKAFS